MSGKLAVAMSHDNKCVQALPCVLLRRVLLLLPDASTLHGIAPLVCSEWADCVDKLKWDWYTSFEVGMTVALRPSPRAIASLLWGKGITDLPRKYCDMTVVVWRESS
jgi:hypothetical protein